MTVCNHFATCCCTAIIIIIGIVKFLHLLFLLSVRIPYVSQRDFTSLLKASSTIHTFQAHKPAFLLAQQEMSISPFVAQLGLFVALALGTVPPV